MQENISGNYKEELLFKLKSKEYREAFVSSHIKNGIAFQIKTMRENKHLTQQELGKLAGRTKPQTAISRLENPNYGSFTVKTLKEIAAAFDVALIVRFVPFSDLVKWELALSTDSLIATSYSEDPYFKKTQSPATATDNTQYRPEIFPPGTLTDVCYISEDYLRQQKTVSVVDNIRYI